jgi:hypothetical protein
MLSFLQMAWACPGGHNSLFTNSGQAEFVNGYSRLENSFSIEARDLPFLIQSNSSGALAGIEAIFRRGKFIFS